DLRGREEQLLHAVGAVVVGRPVGGGAAGAVQLGRRGGQEVGRGGGGPGPDRGRRDVGGGQQPGQRHRQDQHHQRGDGAFFDDVVAAGRAAPRRGVGRRVALTAPLGRSRG